MTVGERARKIRTSKGIQLKFVAKKLGYKSPSSYHAIETGKRKLDADKVEDLAHALGVDVEELFFDNKNRVTRLRED